MSEAKRLLAHFEEQQWVAKGIAIDAGVLRVCEFHGEAFESDPDREPAYRLGNRRFSAGKMEGIFESRHEMTDAIKSAIEDQPDECVSCVNFRAE
jgi:hypothetical protein